VASGRSEEDCCCWLEVRGRIQWRTGGKVEVAVAGQKFWETALANLSS
jgi:hypothetical protein